MKVEQCAPSGFSGKQVGVALTCAGFVLFADLVADEHRDPQFERFRMAAWTAGKLI
jgi:hypothetical protein